MKSHGLHDIRDLLRATIESLKTVLSKLDGKNEAYECPVISGKELTNTLNKAAAVIEDTKARVVSIEKEGVGSFETVVKNPSQFISKSASGKQTVKAEQNRSFDNHEIANNWILKKEAAGKLDFKKTQSIKDVYRRLMGWISKCENLTNHVAEDYKQILIYTKAGDYRAAYTHMVSLMVGDDGRVNDFGMNYIHSGIPFKDGVPLQWYNEEKKIAIDNDGKHISLNAKKNNQDTFLDSGLGSYLIPKEAVKAFLPKLSYREREIVKLRFGIDQPCPYGYVEIGRTFKIPAEKVRRLVTAAIEKICLQTDIDVSSLPTCGDEFFSRSEKVWFNAVKAAIVRLCNQSKNDVFTRRQLVDSQLHTIISETNSSGKTPEQTLSRILQDLRDEGEIEFIARGTYRYKNLTNPG